MFSLQKKPALSAIYSFSAGALVLFSVIGLPEAVGAEFAKVNGKAISSQDVSAAIAGLPDSQRETIRKDVSALRSVVQSLINQEVLIQEAEKAKLDQDAAYRDALAAFRRQYLAAKVIEKNVAPKLTEKAAKAYYSNNKRLFSTDKVQVQHILLANEADAKEMLKKAKAPGADFQELAEAFSKDPSAKNNRGDVGVILRDSPFVKEFKDAAFAGDSGSIVGPVKTAYGFHILKVVDRKMGRPLEYDEVELKVKGALRDEMIETYLSNVRSSARITLDEAAFKAGL
jgi:peptidyl-prolyl cis-trans isomerase C